MFLRVLCPLTGYVWKFSLGKSSTFLGFLALSSSSKLLLPQQLCLHVQELMLFVSCQSEGCASFQPDRLGSSSPQLSPCSLWPFSSVPSMRQG